MCDWLKRIRSKLVKWSVPKRFVCPCCGKVRRLTRRHTGTMYAGDEHNYITSCSDCHARYADYYETLKKETYGR